MAQVPHALRDVVADLPSAPGYLEGKSLADELKLILKKRGVAVGRLKSTTLACYASILKRQLIDSQYVINPNWTEEVNEVIIKHENGNTTDLDYILFRLRDLISNPITMKTAKEWAWIRHQIKKDTVPIDLSSCFLYKGCSNRFIFNADTLRPNAASEARKINSDRRDTLSSVFIENMETFKEFILSGIYSDDADLLFPSLLLACGRRTATLYLQDAIFIPGSSAYSTVYTEILKSQKAPTPKEIPLLVPWDIFCSALSRFRDERGTCKSVNAVHKKHGRWNKRVVAERCAFVHRDPLTPRHLRSIYGILCTTLEKFHNVQPLKAIQDVLLHQNKTTALSYHRITYCNLTSPILIERPWNTTNTDISSQFSITQEYDEMTTSSIVGFEIDQNKYKTAEDMVAVLKELDLTELIDSKRFRPRMRSSSTILTGETLHPVWHWLSSLAYNDNFTIRRINEFVALVISSGASIGPDVWPPKTDRTLQQEAKLKLRDDERKKKKLDKLMAPPKKSTNPSRKRKTPEKVVEAEVQWKDHVNTEAETTVVVTNKTAESLDSVDYT
jgi:hypothetical protein